MSAINALMTRFNAGEVSKSALARVDVDRIRLTAEEQINWMPRKLGSMTMRPGLGYLASTKSDAEARLIPFVSSITKKAILEFTNTVMRIWVDDAKKKLAKRLPLTATAEQRGELNLQQAHATLLFLRAR